MEQLITSRKNAYIRHLRQLRDKRSYRREQGEYVCDGYKMLEEALACGAAITSVLWKEGGAAPETVQPAPTPATQESAQAAPLDSAASPAQAARRRLPPSCREYRASSDLFEYASPLENSPGPVFTVRIPDNEVRPVSCAIVLENVQDPGNVGTVLRTAAAFGIDAVVLCGDCADLYNPKTVRSTMGAIFRQYVYVCDDPAAFAAANSLPLYAAALTAQARDLRATDLTRAAVCIGNEGHGLSAQLLARCDGQLIIPMEPGAESLNAAVAAAVCMWEMRRKRE